MAPTQKPLVTASTVTVYEFEIFDSRRRAWEKAGQLGTLEAISRVGGVAHRTTGLVVDASKVDETGLLTPARQEPYEERPADPA